jgi:hypothetical protein
MTNRPHAQPAPAISEPSANHAQEKQVTNEITASDGRGKKCGAEITVRARSNDRAPCGKRGCVRKRVA